jgi:hemoglobin-like flavoprotein
MTETSDSAEMEATLVAVAEADIDIIPTLFDRFFATFPEQRPAFINLAAASGRMTNETIEALVGLATDESWVPVTITNFVDLHRNYGEIPQGHYTAFVDMVVDALADAAGAEWNDHQAQAWRTQAKRLNMMIAEACQGQTPERSI